MKYTRQCENCIWFDQCHEDEACDCYEPASIDEQEAIEIAEYEADLHIRYDIYQELIVEQDD